MHRWPEHLSATRSVSNEHRGLYAYSDVIRHPILFDSAIPYRSLVTLSKIGGRS